MKREANSPSRMSVPPVPIPACVDSRPGKVPRVRESVVLKAKPSIRQPVILCLQVPAPAVALVCPGRFLASLCPYFTVPFLTASVFLLFLLLSGMLSVQDGSSEYLASQYGLLYHCRVTTRFRDSDSDLWLAPLHASNPTPYFSTGALNR